MSTEKASLPFNPKDLCFYSFLPSLFLPLSFFFYIAIALSLLTCCLPTRYSHHHPVLRWISPLVFGPIIIRLLLIPLDIMAGKRLSICMIRMTVSREYICIRLLLHAVKPEQTHVRGNIFIGNFSCCYCCL